MLATRRPRAQLNHHDSRRYYSGKRLISDLRSFVSLSLSYSWRREFNELYVFYRALREVETENWCWWWRGGGGKNIKILVFQFFAFFSQSTHILNKTFHYKVVERYIYYELRATTTFLSQY